MQHNHKGRAGHRCQNCDYPDGEPGPGGRAVYILEKRDAAGKLDFSNPQPPHLYMTENQLCDHYFRMTKSGDSATMETIRAWYATQGFHFRPKTW